MCSQIRIKLVSHHFVEEIESELRNQYCHGSVEEEEERDEAEDDEPEPEDEIYFLIDDVLCEHTHPVLVLHISRGPNIGEVAGYFSWEGVTHWVALAFSLPLRHAEVAHHLPPVPAELPAEELVRHVELDGQQDKVQELAWTVDEVIHRSL